MRDSPCGRRVLGGEQIYMPSALDKKIDIDLNRNDRGSWKEKETELSGVRSCFSSGSSGDGGFHRMTAY